MSDKNKIWEKQEYETSISFSHFQKYYLLQTAPRTVTKAYRQFQIEKGKKTPQQIKKMNTSGAWNNWANAKDNNGDEIADSKTWAERAEAYDKSLFLVKQKDYEEARSDLLSKEVEDATKQLELWEEISHSFVLHINGLKDEAAKNNTTFNPAQFINKAKEIWKWREEIAVFHRRSLKLPAIIKESPKDKKDDKLTKIEWKEPLDDNDDIGVGEQELMDDIENGKNKRK